MKTDEKVNGKLYLQGMLTPNLIPLEKDSLAWALILLSSYGFAGNGNLFTPFSRVDEIIYFVNRTRILISPTAFKCLGKAIVTVCFGTQFPGEYLGEMGMFLVRNFVRIDRFSHLPYTINLIILRGLIFFGPEINQTQTAFLNNFFCYKVIYCGSTKK